METHLVAHVPKVLRRPITNPSSRRKGDSFVRAGRGRVGRVDWAAVRVKEREVDQWTSLAALTGPAEIVLERRVEEKGQGGEGR